MKAYDGFAEARVVLIRLDGINEIAGVMRFQGWPTMPAGFEFVKMTDRALFYKELPNDPHMFSRRTTGRVFRVPGRRDPADAV